ARLQPRRGVRPDMADGRRDHHRRRDRPRGRTHRRPRHPRRLLRRPPDPSRQRSAAAQAGTMTKQRKILLSVAAVYIVGLVVLGILFGIKGHKNESFLPQEEFHLLTWVKFFGPIGLDKGVLYLLIAGLITTGIMVWVS